VQSEQGRQNNSNFQQQIFDRYLEHFCEKKGSLVDFQEDFDPEYLRKIDEKIKILNSEDLTGLKVDIKKYQEINKQVVLRFTENNKALYTVEDEVRLLVEIKNVSTLYVKVFEFNTETYYKKNLKPFNTAVNLDGLVASEEFIKEYPHPPNKKHVEAFDFPSLTGRVGLFIVEMIGNGVNSRAVIKKGSLSMIHKPTVAGHIAYVLDQNKEICKGPRTGIWFQREYYEANAENGRIFIPYG